MAADRDVTPSDADLYRHLLQTSSLLAAVGDFDGHFVLAAGGWRDVLGYTPERLIGTPYLGLVHPADTERVLVLLGDLMGSSRDVPEFEVRLRAHDGSYRWMVWTLHSELTARRLYGIGRDVSEAYLKEQELIRTREEALEASRVKSQFLANVSHEFRTPMNGILGMTALALSTDLSEEQRDYLQAVHQSAEALLAIINDILDLSKIEARRLAVERKPFALDALLGDVLTVAQTSAQHKGLTLKSSISADAGEMVVGDSVRVGQILRNLLSNAVKFTQSGFVALDVSRSDDRVRFSVSDTGVGIPLDQHECIFEPFRQADGSASRRYGGTGLGLSISRELARLMDGDVWLRSAPGEGSTFAFELALPIAPLATAVQNASMETSETARAAAEHRPSFDAMSVVPLYQPEALEPLNVRVLVAEDNPVNALVVTRMLQRLGCQVQIAENGAHVLELLDAHSFDVILMDVQMPDLDGLEATQRIRAREDAHTSKRCPIIAVTANAMVGDREKCLEAGMDGYLAKPITIENLEREIRRCIARQR
jgi:PAS domain S-box-containing protein